MKSGLLGLLLWFSASSSAAASSPPAGAAGKGGGSPGISAERLQRLDDFLRKATGAHGYLGVVSVVSLDGEAAEVAAYGHRDLARREPMRPDAIFRLYSMTKPITSVAALMLVEEGKLSLDDPVSRYLPEFSSLRCLCGDGDHAAPPPRMPTIRNLMTHTAGFATDASEHPKAAQQLRHVAPEQAGNLADYARRVAQAPLAEAPGTHFHYDGVNTQVLARVIEVVSGQPFGEFLRRRIFTPLRMKDTGFEVPEAQRGRVADLTRMDDDGQLRLADTDSARHPGVRLNRYDNGAGGLYSTAADYLRFARMLANDGELDGVRLLSRKTVDLMMRDQLAGFDPPLAGPAPGEGFGLGGYVVTDVAKRGRLGSEGQFGWSGAASTYFTIDRKERLVAILLAQHLPGDGANELPRLSVPFFNLVYQALP
ncbi:MAG: serine hydrolase domain-containing protein [Pseudoxanthomonas sp.]